MSDQRVRVVTPEEWIAYLRDTPTTWEEQEIADTLERLLATRHSPQCERIIGYDTSKECTCRKSR